MGSTVKGERVTLRDGVVVLVRQVHRTDADLLADGFARLSEESRRLRFLSAKERLTTTELRYFTEVDHHDHEALGALDETDGRGLGVARYIRHAEDPEAAEVAVTVVDEWQRRGLGTELLSRLIDRARQEGVLRFTALVSADNDATIRLLQRVGADVRAVSREPGVVEYEISPPSEGLGSTYDLLKAFGQRQLTPPKSIRDALGALVPEWFRADG
ncbi:MAG TPA: GNAT family N-acetyltransferase [Nocardioidaceae bacterium]|nr:GNAT family N-acetyltransferase [Nocardioidaceae bacterium]